MFTLDFIILQCLPWVLSALTIGSNILIGRRYKNSWLVSMAIHSLWTLWTLYSKNWGLLPLNISLWWVYYSNHLKWSKDHDL